MKFRVLTGDQNNEGITGQNLTHQALLYIPRQSCPFLSIAVLLFRVDLDFDPVNHYKPLTVMDLII